MDATSDKWWRRREVLIEGFFVGDILQKETTDGIPERSDSEKAQCGGSARKGGTWQVIDSCDGVREKISTDTPL